jgi:hypothetical protein
VRPRCAGSITHSSIPADATARASLRHENRSRSTISSTAARANWRIRSRGSPPGVDPGGQRAVILGATGGVLIEPASTSSTARYRCSVMVNSASTRRSVTHHLKPARNASSGVRHCRVTSAVRTFPTSSKRPSGPRAHCCCRPFAPCRSAPGATRQRTRRHRRTRRNPASTEVQRAPGSAGDATNRYGGVGGWRRRFASALWSFAAWRSSLAARRCSVARRKWSSESPWASSASCSCNEAARSWTSAEDSVAVAASSAAIMAARRARSMFSRATRTCSAPEPRISLICAPISPRRSTSSAMRSPSSWAR